MLNLLTCHEDIDVTADLSLWREPCRPSDFNTVDDGGGLCFVIRALTI